MHDPDRDDAKRNTSVPQRPMPAWAIWCGVGVLVVVATVSISLLFSLYGEGTEQDRVRLDILQLAGSIVLGTGGLAALILAARRQRTNELELVHQDRVAADTRHDALERRITDLYSTAAEQLGSDTAPVRIAALLTLERLGQDNPAHRQPVVDLLCAYLRMPFVPPGETEIGQHPPKAGSGAELSDTREELQVRLTAQGVLVSHLRPWLNDVGESINARYWPGIILDLAGAALVQWDLAKGRIERADFSGARFYGEANFLGMAVLGRAAFDLVEFHGRAWFTFSTFRDSAGFSDAVFHGNADFRRANFRGASGFHRAKFHDGATFHSAAFRGAATFQGAVFHAGSSFSGAEFNKTSFNFAMFCGDSEFNAVSFHAIISLVRVKFHGTASFDGSIFNSDVRFTRAKFCLAAWLSDVEFRGEACFRKSRWQDDVWFNNAKFSGCSWFTDARFHTRLSFEEIVVADGGRINLGGARVKNSQKCTLPEPWLVPSPDDLANTRPPDGWWRIVRADYG